MDLHSVKQLIQINRSFQPNTRIIFKRRMKQHIAYQKERPIIFTPVSNSTLKDKSQVFELRNAANFNTGVKRSFLPKIKENIDPKYHSGSVQGVTASSSKSVCELRNAANFNTRVKRSFFPKIKENIDPKYHSGSVQGVTASSSKSVCELRNAANFNTRVKRSFFPKIKENIDPKYHSGSVQGVTASSSKSVCELRNAANFNTGVKYNLFPGNKENVGPKYHSGSVQRVTVSCSKSVSSWKTPDSYIVKIPDPAQLLMSGSSKMPKTFINKVDELEDFDIQHTRTKSFKMKKPVTSSSKTFNKSYIPLLLQSTSSRRFTCVTNHDTPRVAKMSQGEEKQDIASIIVIRALFNDNSNTSTTNSSRISRAPPVICTSSNKDSQAMHLDKISHGGIQDYQNSLEIKSLASESLTHAFPKTTEIDVNDRLSDIPERTETLENQLEFHSKINKPNVPLIVTQCSSVDYVDPQSSGCFGLEQVPTHLRYMNSRPSTSVVKPTSKLPYFVRREGNLERKEKNDSDISENRTILTVKQISTKDSLSKLKSDDEKKSFSGSTIMTRSKWKNLLETGVTLHSDKRLCSTDSSILKINEPEKTETSHSENSSEVLFCSSKGAQTRNDYPLQQNSFVSTTYPDNLPISCGNISKTKAIQTSPFRALTKDKSIVETDTASSVMAAHNNDSVYVKKELLLKLKKQLFEMNNQIDGILSGFIVGATELQNSDFSNEKNKSSVKRTPIRRSQRIAARMSNSLPFVSPGTLPVDEYNAKYCPSTSVLNKSLHMYKELKTDFKFLRTPKRSNKKTPMKSPGTFLSDRVQDQLKLLFD